MPAAKTVKKGCTVFLHPTSQQRLEEMAQEAQMRPGALAGLLLEELLPTVKSVRRRLQIVRHETNGRAA